MKRILLFTLLAVGMASCSNDDNGTFAGQTEDGDAVVLSFSPEVAGAETLSRAIVTGNNFIVGDSVGYILMGDANASRNANLPHIPGYGNIMAQGVRVGTPVTSGPNYVDRWKYYVNNLYQGTRLAGYPSYGKLDIFGYYPYNENVTYLDAHAIPFSIGVINAGVAEATEKSASVDYLWATPKLSYDISVPSNVPVPMHFNHLMTYLEFAVGKVYPGPALTIEELQFEIDGGRQFITKGTYDSATGSIAAIESSDKLVVKYDKTMNNGSYISGTSGYAYCPIIMPPLTVADGDATVTVTFKFNDHGAGLDFLNAGGVYSFKLSDVGGAGLQAGKKYKVTVAISNFVKYSSTAPEIADVWSVGSTEDPENPGEDLGIIEI